MLRRSSRLQTNLPHASPYVDDDEDDALDEDAIAFIYNNETIPQLSEESEDDDVHEDPTYEEIDNEASEDEEVAELGVIEDKSSKSKNEVKFLVTESSILKSSQPTNVLSSNVFKPVLIPVIPIIIKKKTESISVHTVEAKQKNTQIPAHPSSQDRLTKSQWDKFKERFSLTDGLKTSSILVPYPPKSLSLDIVDRFLNTDFQRAYSQTQQLFPLTFYPTNNEICLTAAIEFGKKSDFTIDKSLRTLIPKVNFNQFHESISPLDTLSHRNLGTNVFCLDLERHRFINTPFIRELACISIDGKYGFFSPVCFTSEILEDYEAVQSLNKQPFEEYCAKQGSKVESAPSLVKELSDQKDAPSFATAFQSMLNFLEDKSVKGESPLVLYQGTNDPSTLIFNVLAKNEKTMPNDSFDVIQRSLNKVKPRFVSADAFWKCMKRVLYIPIPYSLPRLTSFLFKTKEEDFNCNYLKSEILQLINLAEAPLPSPTLIVEAQYVEKEDIVRTLTMPFDAVSGDFFHHTADADIMILRNCLAAVVMFFLFVSKIQPHIKNILVRHVNGRTISQALQDEYPSIPGIPLQQIIVKLCTNLQVRSDEDVLLGLGTHLNLELELHKNYRALFKEFMLTIMKVTNQFKEFHLPMTNEMTAFVLSYCMGMASYRRQYGMPGRRLEGFKAAIYDFDNLKARKQIFLPTGQEIREFLYQFPDDKHIIVKARTSKKNWIELQKDMKNDNRKETFDELLHTSYHHRNLLLTKPEEPEKVNESVVFHRRNWPLFLNTHDIQLKRKLHNRFCLTLMMNIDCLLLIDGEYVKATVRTYKSDKIIKKLSVFSSLYLSTQSNSTSISFCKDCKRYKGEYSKTATTDAKISDLTYFAHIDETQYDYPSWLEKYKLFNVPVEIKRAYLLQTKEKAEEYATQIQNHSERNEINIKTRESSVKGFISLNTRGLKVETASSSESLHPKTACQELQKLLFEFNQASSQPSLLTSSQYEKLSPIISGLLYSIALRGPNARWTEEIMFFTLEFACWLSILCPLLHQNNYDVSNVIGTILKLPSHDPENRKLTYKTKMTLEGLLSIRLSMRAHSHWSNTWISFTHFLAKTPLASTLKEYSKLYRDEKIEYVNVAK